MLGKKLNNFSELKSILDKYIIPLLDFAYENKDVFIMPPPKEYMNCYTAIDFYSYNGDDYGYQVYDYHKKK